MQSWKLKKKADKYAAKPTRRKGLLMAVLLLLTLVSGTYDFPYLWNKGAEAVKNVTAWQPPVLDESPYRLGLDLQGGTHLVYEADMSGIQVGDQADALEGVRDVIERRVNAFGVSEPVVQTINSGGAQRVIVELAGVLDVNQAINEIGETPVLEFKEPGVDLGRDLTEEEKAALAQLNRDELAAANVILARAKKGEDFTKLMQEADPSSAPEVTADGVVVVNETPATIKNVTADNPRYGVIGKAIETSRVRAGGIVPTVLDTPEGYAVVKYVGVSDGQEMLLSHILTCFEGKKGCANALSALDASLRMEEIKKEATPENFAELAKARSDDPSAAQNSGDLDWVKPGATVPTFEIEAAKTAKGTVSNVVETEFGYHLIYKRDERTIKTYEIQRILLKKSGVTDVVPDASPWKSTGLSGKHLARASAQFDPQTNIPYVNLEFNAEGGELFAQITAAHVGDPIAIFLDGQPISTPTVQQAIYGGQAVINGSFTVEEAKLLAQRLNAGALPVPVKLLSQETVGPTLGIASLHKSIVAGLVGFLLVAVFMILVYRLPGALAVLALVLYTALNLAAYRVFGVTISLSGIAGLILSLGIAVDANVLIFERMKDEYRSGRDFALAIEEGFRRAWAPIRDGHMTTFISAAVLYAFSSSFVRGFALTLGVGVVLSLFTAITVTRTYVRFATSFPALRRPGLFAFKRKA